MPVGEFFVIVGAIAIVVTAVLLWALRSGGVRRLWLACAALFVVVVAVSVALAAIPGPFRLPMRALVLTFVPWFGFPVLAAAGTLQLLHGRRVHASMQAMATLAVTLVALPLGFSIALLLSDRW